MGMELLFLLLPVAAFSGWLIGRSSQKKKGNPDSECDDFSNDYFKGLNYLLNEQPDKAIEIFIRMLEVDSDTVETHLALANLFRRRGEVERAIRIHQNLIARPSLLKRQRNQALYELGRDYMSAGLLDRAESLFREVEDEEYFGAQALRQLRDIFEQEKEWNNAIDVAQRLKQSGEQGINQVIAHYYCELTEEAIQQGDLKVASKMVRQASGEDKNCIRATLLESEIAKRNNNYRQAIKSLNRIEQQDKEFFTEAMPLLKECYGMVGKKQELLAYLQRINSNNTPVSFMITQAELIREEKGNKEAEMFVADQLRQHPTLQGLDHLVGLKLAANEGNNDLAMLKELLEKFVNNRPAYICSNCGYTAKTMDWHCPSCRQWNTVRPMRDSY